MRLYNVHVYMYKIRYEANIMIKYNNQLSFISQYTIQIKYHRGNPSYRGEFSIFFFEGKHTVDTQQKLDGVG